MVTTAPTATQPAWSMSIVVPQSAVPGFKVTLPEQLFSNATGPIRIATATGAPPPAWLSFDPVSRQFSSTDVPLGGFPLKLVLTIDGQQVVVELTSPL